MEDFRGHGSTFEIDGTSYKLDFTMASISYLAEKYGDVGSLFKKMKSGLDAQSINLVCDMLYAAMLVYDEATDSCKAPLSVNKLKTKLHINDITIATKAITEAFSGAFAKVEADPTQAGTSPAQNGTGDTSTLPEQSS